MTCETTPELMTKPAPMQPPLTALLHPDKNVRIDAVLAIGKLADTLALPALLDRLGREPDPFSSART